VFDLILASTSPYRRAQMERLGVSFRSVAPPIDEEALKDLSLTPCALALRLATGKAQCVADTNPGAIVIGGDQLVAFEGGVLGKPGNLPSAAEQLMGMTGRSHELITAISVVFGDELRTHVDVTTLWLRPLTRAEIERYVAADRPIDCAGSYKLEERGITLFERIQSEDQTAVTGLPLIALASILRGFGLAIP
jgi:septum formation protein